MGALRGGLAVRDIKLWITKINFKISSRDLKDFFNEVRRHRTMLAQEEIEGDFPRSSCPTTADFLFSFFFPPPPTCCADAQVDTLKQGVIGEDGFSELYHNMIEDPELSKLFDRHCSSASGWVILCSSSLRGRDYSSKHLELIQQKQSFALDQSLL